MKIAPECERIFISFIEGNSASINRHFPADNPLKVAIYAKTPAFYSDSAKIFLTMSKNKTKPDSENLSDGQIKEAFSEDQIVANAERSADDMCHEEQALNISELNLKLDEAIVEADKNRDLYLRAVADLDTYRRKVQREKQELSKFALQPFVEELLPSIDHLEMAIEASKTSGESKNLIVGVEMVSSQIKKLLEKYGIEEIKADGQDFDPNLEDCVSHEPSKSVPENKVVKVVRRGYTYNGRLIRPASVVVSSGKKE